MRIPIDRQSTIPLYQQIEHYIRQGILGGTLAPDMRLPATRQLAEDLGVSRITVENAYAALESDGFVVRQAGSGTYILPSALDSTRTGKHPPEWPFWQNQALLAAGLTLAEPVMRQEQPAAQQPIAFTGFGDPHLFPTDEFSKAIRDVIRRDGSECLGFDDLRGYAPLRTTIAHILASQGVQVHPDHVLVTSGSQQALALIVQLLLKPGDTVLVEAPTYDGALDLFRAHQLQLVGCPADAQGMHVEQLEPFLQQHHPKLIYTIPNFQNPSGACLSLARRHQLVALADRYNIPLLEDDFVGELRYEGRILPALKALDPGGRVIYVGTFSKLLMPGLRIGFLVADGPIYDLLVQLKRVNDLVTSPLIQRALELYISVGRYHAHVRRSCQVYRKRRDTLVRALGRTIGTRIELVSPHGGLFVWAKLADGTSTAHMLPIAQEEGVEYAVGTRFFPRPADGESFMRLNFATQTADDIEEGVRRLAQALHRQHVRMLR